MSFQKQTFWKRRWSMCEVTVEGECPACGTTVRYTGHVPYNYLCGDCGGERPHADGVYADENGVLHYEEPA